MRDPGLRASDEDRQRVVTFLEQHTAAGRLSLEEFSERVRLVYASVTFGDLALITHDLPANGPDVAGHPSGSAHPGGTDHRQLLLAFLLAAITIAVLGIILAAAR